MNRIARSRSGLMLTELLFAILFFSLGSAVCIRLTAQARLDSREAQDISFAAAQVSGASSAVRYTDGSLGELSAYYPYAQEDGDAILVFYNKDREQSGKREAAYILTIRMSSSGIRKDAVITMSAKDGGTIYELRTFFPAPGQDARKEELP